MNRDKVISYLKEKRKADIFAIKSTTPNPNYQMPSIANDSEWILHLYHNILDEKKTDINDDGYKHWMARINVELTRPQIEQYFRQVAAQKLFEKQAKTLKFEDFLNPNDKGRVVVVIPEKEEDVFLVSSLFKSIKDRYPEYALYVATKPQFKSIIDANPLVDRWLEYSPIMDNIFWLEGRGTEKGYFNVAYLPHLQTQRLQCQPHNGEDKIDFNLR